MHWTDELILDWSAWLVPGLKTGEVTATRLWELNINVLFLTICHSSKKYSWSWSWIYKSKNRSNGAWTNASKQQRRHFQLDLYINGASNSRWPWRRLFVERYYGKSVVDPVLKTRARIQGYHFAAHGLKNHIKCFFYTYIDITLWANFKSTYTNKQNLFTKEWKQRMKYNSVLNATISVTEHETLIDKTTKFSNITTRSF